MLRTRNARTSPLAVNRHGHAELPSDHSFAAAATITGAIHAGLPVANVQTHGAGHASHTGTRSSNKPVVRTDTVAHVPRDLRTDTVIHVRGDVRADTVVRNLRSHEDEGAGRRADVRADAGANGRLDGGDDADRRADVRAHSLVRGDAHRVARRRVASHVRSHREGLARRRISYLRSNNEGDADLADVRAHSLVLGAAGRVARRRVSYVRADEKCGADA